MDYTGWIGVLLILIFLFLVFAIYQFNLTLNYFKQRREKKEEERRRQAALIAEQRIKDELERENSIFNNHNEETYTNYNDDKEDDGSDLPPVTSYTKDPDFEVVSPDDNKPKENVFTHPVEETPLITDLNEAKPQEAVMEKQDEPENDVTLEIAETTKEETIEAPKGNEHFTIDTPFDPRYELSDYKFPTLDMLNDYGGGKSEIDEAELNANKDKIVATLGNYGIAIDKIKATIGPTVTLYEIVPAAGVRISKIKNLEDDIA